MDHGMRKFLWLITSVLGQCDLQDTNERKELQEISKRLKRLVGTYPDELSCQRIEDVSAGNHRKSSSVDVEERTWPKGN